MSKWQPIETAPKDGTVVILYSPGRRRRGEGLGRFMGRYRKPDVAWQLVRDDKKEESIPDDTAPTHWMPLPEPPT